MTTLAVPGVNISILRQQTTTRRGLPLLISGRVSVLGLPIFAAVRVTLEGPSFDPRVTNFDTLAAPTGDYNVNIIADQDGVYSVQAKAFPPVVLPFAPPGLPSLLDILPPLAESTSPPLIVGQPLNGTVGIDAPAGPSRVPLPALTRIEVGAPVTVGAPVIPITIGAPGAPAFPAFPFPPPTGLPPTPPAAVPVIITEIVLPPEEEEVAPAPGVISAQIVGFTLES